MEGTNQKPEFWKEFNLAEANPAQGGGILYCLRYSKDRLEGHQEQVINGLESLGAEIDEIGGNGLEVFLMTQDRSKLARASRLLEELSVINEALEYNSDGLGDYKSIPELKDGLILRYLQEISGRGDIVEAYNFVDMFIPQIVRDLRVSEKQGKKYSRVEAEAIEELANFAKRQTDHLNDPRGYVLFG